VDPRRPSLLGRIVTFAVEACFFLAVFLEICACTFAVTWFLHGACALLAGGALAVRLVVSPPRRRGLRRALGVVALAAAAFGLVVVDVEFFQHIRRDESFLQSDHLPGADRGGVLGVLDLIPEVDAVSLGIAAARHLGLGREEQMADVRGLLMKEYAAIRQTQGFAHAGNVAAAGVMRDGGGYFFRYLPQGYSAGRKWPLLVFLHGAGGNFVLYPWLWSRFADQHGFVVLCPTWDSGMWDQPKGTQVALDAIQATTTACSIDERRVFLVGLSNGAITGWAVLAAQPKAFRGFVSISGGATSVQDVVAARHVPVLFLHGARDTIIPIDLPRKVHARLARARADTTLVEFPDDDHFLLLRSTDKVISRIAEWIQSHQ